MSARRRPSRKRVVMGHGGIPELDPETRAAFEASLRKYAKLYERLADL